MMTEIEAWRRLAAEFRRPRKERMAEPDFVFGNGLCFAIQDYPERLPLDEETRRRMRAKIWAAVDEQAYEDDLLLAPYTDEGDKVRVALCERMIADLTQQEEAATR